MYSLKVSSKQVLVTLKETQQLLFVLTMKCTLCPKDLSATEIKKQDSTISIKRSQIQTLRALILQEKNKLNSSLQQHLSFRLQHENNNENSQTSAKKQLLSKNFDQISKKQNILIEVKKLRKTVQEKQTLLRRYKQRRNQKFKQFSVYEKVVEIIKKQITPQFEERITSLKKIINGKAESLKSLNQEIKKYFEEIVKGDISALLRIQDGFVSFQKRVLFQIQQGNELELLNYSKLKDSVAQSFYEELENIQQVAIKSKASEKGVHVLYQNILILFLLQKIYGFWLPYPINIEINFNESKLISEIEGINICDKKMIDYSKSTKLSFNIVQFFPQQLKKIESIEKKDSFGESQYFERLQMDESIQYNERRYELNKSFIHYLQANAEFLCKKYGIKDRPLVFFDIKLITQIVNEYLSRHSYNKIGQQYPCPVKEQQQQYKSMLKQIQLSKLVDSLLQNELKLKKCRSEDMMMIAEEDVQIYSQNSESNSIDPENLNYNSWSLNSIKQSVYQIFVPQTLQAVKSNDTDNDEFQLLSM